MDKRLDSGKSEGPMPISEIAMMTGMIAAAAGVAFAISRIARHLFVGIEPRAVERPKSDLAPGVLFAIACSGGANPDAAALAAEQVHGSQVTTREGVDVFTWAEAFANGKSLEEREALLEEGVRVAMRFSRTFPPAQYDALLDLTFGLGLHSDSIARMRDRFGFAFLDYSTKRPREADRSGATRFVDHTSREESLRILGLTAGARRADVISAYRNLVRQHHPDRFHDAAEDERDRAAERFRRIVAAYDELLRDSIPD